MNSLYRCSVMHAARSCANSMGEDNIFSGSKKASSCCFSFPYIEAVLHRWTSLNGGLVAERGDAGLNRDLAIVRSKGLLAKHGVEINRPDGQPFEQRVLRHGWRREQPDREAEVQDREIA